MFTAQTAARASVIRSATLLESLKDYDDLGWIHDIEPGLRADWLRRLQWIRMVDRLAVEETLAADAESFANHFILPCDPFDLGVTWREAWRGYIEAAHRQRHCEVVVDLTAHQHKLVELSGNMFCLFPEVDFGVRHAIARFGALDRFFSNLRDLSQDLRRGVQHFPLELLKDHGLSARELTNHRVRSTPAYLGLMRFWLDEYLPALRQQAVEFSHMNGLPSGLRVMRRACLRRHARIEGIFRECGLDFELAGRAYWLEVERLRQISCEH